MSGQPRYGRASRTAAAEREESHYVALDRRRALHAFDLGALAAIGSALLYGFLWGTGLQFGLVAVAIMLGWLIGAAVRYAAWKGLPHHPTRRLQLLGATLGVATWFGAALVAHLVSRALLPESDLSYAERLADLPFWAFMDQQYEAGGIFHAIALAALVIMGWRTAR
ncbi:hypothetical protein BH24CHL6_BH24CHL6_03290 [soil metagenome]